MILWSGWVILLARYKLEYVVVDYGHAKDNVVKPKKTNVSVELSYAETLAQFDIADGEPRKSRDKVSCIHYYVMHFRPKSDTMKMVFAYDADEDRKCTINFIKIEPLFEKRR